MLLDVSELDDRFELSCDVAIVGAGAAGITLARELAASRLAVVVVESGGLAIEPASQELNRGEVSGLPYPDLAATRLRLLGGTTQHWTGELGALDEPDFASRPWLPASGWPIERSTLAPHYARALAACGLDPEPRDPAPPVPGTPWRSRRLRLAYRRRRADGPLRFGAAYRDELSRASNVRVILHANVVGIVAGGARRVDRLELRSLGGRSGSVRAGRFVLACGGIENARLLLASARRSPEVAGAGADWIGRCFMDHPVHRPLRLMARPIRVAALRRRRSGNLVWLPDLAPTTELQEAEAVASFGAELHEARRRPGPELEASAASAWRLHEQIEGRSPEGRAPALFDIEIMQEQTPDRASRVTLDDERDALGVPRVRVDYRHSALDARTARVAAETIARELGRLGLGRVGVAGGFAPGGAGWDWPWRVAQHQLGTTRMADGPSRGATDADGRPFGVGNLYVAGGSLFPTCGYVNPTLTIVALALRLAERLRSTE